MQKWTFQAYFKIYTASGLVYLCWPINPPAIRIVKAERTNAGWFILDAIINNWMQGEKET